MAVQVRHYRVDDLEVLRNPGQEVAADRTIRFSVDEQQWEIDLNSGNAAGFFEAIRPYKEAARRLPSKSRPRPKAQRDTAARIREWARERKIDVNEKGRIPGDVVRRYEEAMAT